MKVRNWALWLFALMLGLSALVGGCAPMPVQTSACEQDGGCAAEIEEVGAASEAIIGPCGSNSDCRSGQICWYGSCRTRQCSSNADCAPGNSCFGGICL